MIIAGEIFHGGPGLIQGRLGTPGHFEVVVPSELALGLAHYWRG